MTEVIVAIIIGIVCIILGILNAKGNISTLHSYHTKRVKEEDRIPFGRTVGLGTIICGIAVVVFGAFKGVNYFTGEEIYSFIASIVLIVGLIVGLGISFYAMFKYNKGIF